MQRPALPPQETPSLPRWNLPLRAPGAFAAFAALGVLTLGAGSAHANDQWKERGKECDATVFKSPADAETSEISKCSKVWVAYRTNYAAVKGEYKDRVVLAMRLLYAKGDDADAERSKEILERLGVTDLPKRTARGESSQGRPKAQAKPARQPFNPPAPDKKQIAAAEKHFKAGFAAYKKNDHAKALAAYEQMVAAAPGYAKGHFNAACIHALQKNEAGMAKYLMNLRDMATAGNEDAAKMLKLTRTDTDFDGIRDESTEYKRITGYAKVKLINHMGERGEENIDNLKSSLEQLGYATAMKDSSKKVAPFPIVYFTDHSKNQAFITTKLITHPKLETKYLEKDKLCGEDGCFDVVVQWSDEVKKGDPPKHVADPKDAEKKIADLEKKQDEILRKPDEVLGEVDDALSKPEEVSDKVEEIMDKPGKAVEKVEKTLDKVKKIF